MLEKFEIFRTWFLRNIMNVEETNTIIVLPVEEDLKPLYRDDIPAIPSVPPAGLASLHLSPILGAPELVLPSMFASEQIWLHSNTRCLC